MKAIFQGSGDNLEMMERNTKDTERMSDVYTLKYVCCRNALSKNVWKVLSIKQIKVVFHTSLYN